jgi:signal recognition particle receptor subunit beta
VQLQHGARELTIKLVYYGPGLGGKTTNLAMLHERLQSEARGELVTLETADDRTLFFDMLPLQIGGGLRNFRVRVKVFTVPGQPIHASARRLVLGGADGVAFIADSRLSHIETNAQSFTELRDNLQAHDMRIDQIPLVIQFNKRDLPKVRGDEELHRIAARSREMVFPAVASRGTGVIETFLALFQLTWTMLDQQHQLSDKLGLEPELPPREMASLLGMVQPIGQLVNCRYGCGVPTGKGAQPA